MSLKEVVTIPEPVLRQKAKKVKNFDGDLQVLINDMIETMREAPGVGLAAPQVAVSNRLVVVEFGDEEDETVEPKLYVVVNPEITKHSEEMVNGVEGCLSIPNIVGDVDRYESIVVKGQNRHGQPMKIKASGWLARIFQHEIDHLEGVLFTDLANQVWQPQEDETFADV